MALKKMIHTYLLPLHDEHPEALLYFAGSVAAAFQNHLFEAAADANLKIANIIKEHINNLLTYYSRKN
jgi:glucosamine kinase